MQVKEEEEYLEWLKGQKQTLSKDKSTAAELVCCTINASILNQDNKIYHA